MDTWVSRGIPTETKMFECDEFGEIRTIQRVPDGERRLHTPYSIVPTVVV
jgi:hypothetical protein